LESCPTLEFGFDIDARLEPGELREVTYGTDIFFSPTEVPDEQVKMMERLLKWYEPVAILKMATGNAGELFKLSGLRNPYPGGVALSPQADTPICYSSTATPWTISPP
jgi:hypothetical protein